MKKNNAKVSQRKAKRNSKNLKRISKKNNSGISTINITKQLELTPEQRSNAEKALAGSLELTNEELAVVEPWSVKNE